MFKQTLISLGLTLITTPAVAGQAQRAVSVCKAAAANAANGAASVVRSIDPSGKQTRVAIIVGEGADKRRFNCRVDYRGEIMLAEFDRPAASASASR